MTVITDPTARQIKRALISVSDKQGVAEFAKALAAFDVEILSTGGTARLLREAGIMVTDVSDVTKFPEIMDGRVKTLHPCIHGGLLARRENSEHVQAMQDNDIAPIDMLVANLYPFVKTIESDAGYDTCIENIDIGGPAMIRAAAKNHNDVTVLIDPQDYDLVLDSMKKNQGGVSGKIRKRLAATAFSLTATYDSNIASWMIGQMGEDFGVPRRVNFAGTRKQTLRYGENPHQNAALYLVDNSRRPGVARARQLQGKELSYNNINDADAAFELVADFDAPTVAIIKHANPCGVASSDNVSNAYSKALLCDPVSAFGGIIAINKPLDSESAALMTQKFVEVIVAPSIEVDAIEILKKKGNIRVLETGSMPDQNQKRRQIKRIAGGLLVQDTDLECISNDDLKVVSDREPTARELKDMLFAFRVAKHVKSNAIVYAKNGATVGIGAGQMSRLDSARIAALKAKDAAEAAGLDEPLTKDSVVASDAFFSLRGWAHCCCRCGCNGCDSTGWIKT